MNRKIFVKTIVFHFLIRYRDIPALPILRFETESVKPMDSSYPKDPTSIGEHIRKKRIELKLFQKDLVDLFGVSEDFITYWENNRSTPQIHYYPALIRFLGYCPFELDLTTFEGRIKAYRYLHGLSRKHFAKLMAVDPQTIVNWENGRGKRSKREKMKRFLLKYDFNADYPTHPV